MDKKQIENVTKTSDHVDNYSNDFDNILKIFEKIEKDIVVIIIILILTSVLLWGDIVIELIKFIKF